MTFIPWTSVSGEARKHNEILLKIALLAQPAWLNG